MNFAVVMLLVSMSRPSKVCSHAPDAQAAEGQTVRHTKW
jgi:hypothetical protein